jgi:hypothetical protein
MGRPSKYRPELCADLIKFFNRPLYITKKHKEWVGGELKIIEDDVPNKTPWLVDWCLEHKISIDLPQDWSKAHPEFLRALNTAKKIQERFLAELGIKGDHNAFMTFQALKNVAGWRDKTETEVTGGQVAITIVNAYRGPQKPRDSDTGIPNVRDALAA